MPDMDALRARCEAGIAGWIEEWKELLRFPTVSADRSRDADCRNCAVWLARHLDGIGVPARLLETSGKPVVFGERPGRRGAPTALYYAHYDVQPADPLDKWTTPPFEPALRNGRLYARGAEDNKGQLFYALKAMQTLIAADALGVGLKVVIDGEEESGSGGLSGSLPAWRERLAADVLLVTDTGTVASGAPTLVMGLRGVIFVNFTLTGPNHDLHSGAHGGVAPNPAQGVAEMLAGLHTPDGAIAVQGYYNGIQPPDESERRLAAETPFDASDYARRIGVPPAGGERALPAQERVGFRPTLEVNGVHGGYGGAGTKTVIPSSASAKLSSRLVPGQDPRRCLDLLREHLRAHVPPGLALRIDACDATGPGFRLDPASPLVRVARGVLEAVGGGPVAMHWEGASIPIVAALAAASGAQPLLCGFGSDADNIHAPDESFSLDQFRRGFLYVAGILQALDSRGEGWYRSPA